jgi:hypothetical protein
MLPRNERALLVPTALVALVAVGFAMAQEPDPEPQAEANPLLEAADEVLQEIVALRGLELKAPVPKGVKGRDQIRQYVVKQLAKDYPPERLEKDRQVYVLLGLLEPDLDLHQAILDLLTDQIAGFYDTDTETFYIADWIPDSMQRPVMAHELMHALQDQHFDLDALLKAVEDNDDRLLALEALIEGEGVAVMFDYMLKPVGTQFQFLPGLAEMIEDNAGVADSASSVFARSPAYLRSLLTFPYSYGAGFLQYFRKRRGWEEMSSLYASPPLSSEQILHPEKYFEVRDDPTPLAPQGPLTPIPAQWPRLHQGVLGEFTLFQALDPSGDEKAARIASEGWDGDLFELFEGPQGQLALVLRTVWDTPEDAVEFHQAEQSVLLKRYPAQEEIEKAAAEQVAWQSGSLQIRLSLSGAQVDLVQLKEPQSH